jgi:hypothetical protein
MTLIRRLIERVRRCAAPRPLLVCTDGLGDFSKRISVFRLLTPG